MKAAARSSDTRPGTRRRIPTVPGLDVLGHLALIAVIVFAILALAGPWLAPQDPHAVDLAHSYGSADIHHIFGYDQQGRDILSRLLNGARASFLGPLIIVAVATSLGMLIAVVAAWRKGWVDAVLSGILDSALAFPGLLLAVVVVAVVGPGIQATVIALAIAYTPYMARIVRSAALVEIEKAYIDAARVQGFSAWYICRTHVIPNIVPIILGQAILTLAWATIDIAGLSFLGLGIQPPAADWGIMLANGQAGVLQGHISESLIAGLALVAGISSFSLLGERLVRRGAAVAA